MNVHISSDRWRSMDSEWHKMWEEVKDSVADGGEPKRRDPGACGS
jgi:hypothetical protein